MKYAVWQEEIAPQTGTPHLQGYLCLAAATTLKGIKKILPGAHWEPRRGTHEQAVTYVTKGADACTACGEDHSYDTWLWLHEDYNDNNRLCDYVCIPHKQ